MENNMSEEPQLFRYLNKPKRKNHFWRIFAVFLVIVAIVGIGAFLFWGIFKIEGETFPFKSHLPFTNDSPSPTPEPTMAPTPTPTPTPEPTESPKEAIGTENAVLSNEILARLREDKRSPVKVRGIYVTGPRAGSSGMEDLIKLVEDTELNAMVIDIKNDKGEITYKMDLPLAREIGAAIGYIPDIESLIKTLKEKNIYLIARIVAFKDPILAENRKDYSLKTADGEIFRDKDGLAWVNPYRREVWDYLIDVSKEAVNLGFDEIQFDYIRFSTDNGMADVDFGKDEKNYSKQEIINGFTKYAYEQLMPLGVYVSADVYGAIINSSVDADIVGQNYAQMSRCLDYICPMIYPSHYADGAYNISHPDTEPYTLILKALEDSKLVLAADQAGHQAVVRPWLQDFTATWLENHISYDAKAIRDQINAVYDAGYEEWILWSGNNHYTADGLLAD